MPLERLLELEVLQTPQLYGLVAAGGREVLDVRAYQALEYVPLVGREPVQGLEVGHAPRLTDEAPHEAGPVVVRRHSQAAVVRHADRADGRPDLGDKLAAARTLREFPNAHVPVLIARYQLLLVRVHDHRVHGRPALVLLLEVLRPQVPQLHRPVLGARVHELAVLVEAQGSHVPGVALIRAQGLRIIGVHVVHPDVRVPGRRYQPLVRCYFDAVYLRVRVLDSPVTRPACRFPEAQSVVITPRRQHHARTRHDPLPPRSGAQRKTQEETKPPRTFPSANPPSPRRRRLPKPFKPVVLPNPARQSQYTLPPLGLPTLVP
mmetsp:Transcript_4513/g.13369  ORF Transcript_4513/g.13369 Transcript_4513/m.13369 type:complete len:319 (-) Transcript_4513:1268-2224(-)